MRQAVDESELVASAAIAYAELRAAVARAGRDGRISAADRAQTRMAIDALWDVLAEIPIDSLLVRRAADLADEHALRGYDAVHLAAAITLGQPADVSVACWDAELAAAARALGYRVVGSA